MNSLTAEFRFYEELNDFLPPMKRKINFLHHFPKTSSVKDIIESLGVPHTEVDLILANGKSVDFSYRPQNNDQLSIYPVFETFDISPVTRLRPKPLRDPKFILDVHLGKLVKYLRLLGFYVIYNNQYEDNDLIDIAEINNYIILTRDVPLLKNKRVMRGYWVRNVTPIKQAQEVITKFDLTTKIHSFTRCLTCNGILNPIKKSEIKSLLEPLTEKYYEHFSECNDCHKIYWQGSHYKKMQEIIFNILGPTKQ